MTPEAADRDPTRQNAAAFIERWTDVGAAERANYALFLTELCDVLQVPRPDPARDDTAHNAYVFERTVPLHQRDGKTTHGRIDLYKRDCFVLEAKQYADRPAEPDTLSLALGELSGATRKARIARGTEAWDDAMLAARGQAERYARALPGGEPTPPFLLVVDVGHVIELYADFSQQGKAYLPFPDARSHRIRLADLGQPAARERLRAVWTAPRSLDPARISAAVTREVAAHLAELAKSFERRHDPKEVAAFLSRCLFCMFAEDVGLLPRDGFKHLLDSVKDDPGAFVPLVQLLFEDMNAGRFSGLLRKKLLAFNGGLFSEARALPVDGTQLGLLRRAAACEWRHVEPAIFGTLLERALTPGERHKLGAHYTPRAYVERLVLPTVVEPLRDDWKAVQAAAITEAKRGRLDAARATVRAFHHQLCSVRVLDPACGSGNFLYVALEHLKRLEGEIFDTLGQLGDALPLDLASETVDPHQFLGIEVNPRAAAIAELVLWIGYLQWHFRTRGDALPHEPVLRNFKNIEHRDAVLAYDEEQFAKDEHGQTKFVWDRRTMKVDPATGREVPDGNAVVPLKIYTNPRPAEWPPADFIVGNPPFLGASRLREDLGDGYTETLRKTYPAMPESADFVMWWWHKASLEVLAGRSRRFGFITTNSIRQTFNRRVVQSAMDAGLYLTFAIPDHPWVDTAEGAAVRIAMTVGASTLPKPEPKLQRVVHETPAGNGENAVQLSLDLASISPDLTTGANVASVKPLKSNEAIGSPGVKLHGSGFIVTKEEAAKIGLGCIPGIERHIRPYRNGKDLADTPRDCFVIDLFDLPADEVRLSFPLIYDHVLAKVKPERDAKGQTKDGAAYAKLWWLHGKPRPELRRALAGLKRFIATGETGKHRFFQFLGGEILPDNMLIAVASDDAFHLGVLSSRIHAVYALAAGGRLGVGNDPRYNKSRCFDPFPFPDCTEHQKVRIRALAEELDAHRKRAQAQHGVGLTDLYNVLEKVRVGAALTSKEKHLHDVALVATLRQLHEDLDTAVAEAYGWPWPLTDAGILERVVALNAARAADEAKGIVRWLRPDYQKPLLAAPQQSALGLADAPAAGAVSARDRSGRPRRKAAPTANRTAKQPWPKPLAERIRAVELALAAEPKPATAATLAQRFARAQPADIAEILDTLVTLGRAHHGDAADTFVC